MPRVSLVTEMLRNSDVARFVASLLPSALKENRLHRVLLAFNAATMHEFIFRNKTLSEGTMAYILPAVLEPLEKRPDASRDAIVCIDDLSRLFHLNLDSFSLAALFFSPHYPKNVSFRRQH